MRAFIETCQLQEELLEELGLPEDDSDTSQWNEFWDRWTAAPALKLVRSHFISPVGPLMHAPALYLFAMQSVYKRTSYGHTGTLPHDMGLELMQLLGGDPSLHTLAILAAGLPIARKDNGWGRGACLYIHSW